jgi:hypothetical protein
MRSGEEIQRELQKFVTRWRGYSGSEHGEAQTFLNELVACFGADRKNAGARFEDAHTATGIMDMYWPSVCIVEMKAPSRADKLPEHRRRFVASVAQGKRLLFAWTDEWTCPSNLTYVFAFDDDYSMGILSSFTHGAWARSRSSTLEERLRYTPTSVFATFPWPYPVTDVLRGQVGSASRDVISRRHEICTKEDIGLTALYNLVDEGAYTDLKALHKQLDEAVAAAYGWPKAAAQDGDEIVQRLLELNREITAGTRTYDPFGAQVGSDVLVLFGRD